MQTIEYDDVHLIHEEALMKVFVAMNLQFPMALWLMVLRPLAVKAPTRANRRVIALLICN